MKLYGVKQQYIEKIWPDVEHLIAQALEYDDGKLTPESIRQGLIEREMQLWLVMDERIRAVLVTTLHVFPLKKVALVLLMAGYGMNEWLDIAKSGIEAWATERGCASLEIYGRPGWRRVLRDFTEIHVVLRKELPIDEQRQGRQQAVK